MSEKRRVEVIIGGMSYAILSNDPEEKVQAVVERVNQLMDDVVRNNPRLSDNNAAILCAVNAVWESMEEKVDPEVLKLREQIERMEKYHADIEKKREEEKLALQDKIAEKEATIVTIQDKLNAASKLSMDLKEELEAKEKEFSEYRIKYNEFQDKLLKSETDLIQAKKELQETRKKQGL